MKKVVSMKSPKFFCKEQETQARKMSNAKCQITQCQIGDGFYLFDICIFGIGSI